MTNNHHFTQNPPQRFIDLNCDFGEGYGAYTFGQDAALLAHVTSVNIACGLHAGDPHTMRKAVEMAASAGAAIGAHPGLPDRLGFGRREMAVSAEEVFDLTLYQIGALDAFARAAGSSLRHVKPHGALYHMAGRSAELADAFVRAVKAFHPSLMIYGQWASELLNAADRHGLRKVSEVFADRSYQTDGHLTPRHLPGATLSSSEEALRQTIGMVARGTVRTIGGADIAIQGDTVCLHGDGPRAAEFAAALREGLEAAGIGVRPPQ
ncbi:LamB/YcsF family protein [Paenibacillus montanisoli]|uniref:5-oxoprolinase subunit A n=1 Tax=Paenibacillus montanisoli TaxID=2081970 RepID=A0A328U927_9BACL|nr:5-oxoprolinase subunit PxpA [Paenibacillus montanisoli]RAP78612.1 LamB/YcsF family protein [Paenibacillus montanisoli]